MADETSNIQSSLIDILSTGIIVLNDDRKIIHWNRWMERHSGRASAEVTGLSILQVFPQLEDSRIQQAIEQALTNGYPTVISHLFNNNPLPLYVQNESSKKELLKYTAQISPLNENSHSTCLIQITDVTASVKREKALQEQINIRKQIEEELRHSIIRAELAVKAKSDFLATMSHEIRTPMNGILGMAQLLEMTELSDIQKDYVNIINNSGNALLLIINDILDFSKIEANKMILAEEPFDLLVSIRDILALIKPVAARKDLTIQFDYCPGTIPNLIGDSGRIRQILLNLLNNAVKFTESGNILIKLQVQLDDDNRSAEIFTQVTDTGPGISEEVQQNLFSPFTQADSSTTRKYGGTGLGLAICKKLVELMDGEIGVDSTIDKGSTFWMRFTLPVLDTATVSQTHTDTSLDHHSTFRGSALLVEDNEINQLVTQAMLGELGLDVTLASDGSEALKLCQQQQFDLIFMDCQMPVMDGYEATRLIRQLQGHVATPIIAITANVQQDEKQQCYDSGMNDYIAKPYIFNDLLSKVSRWMNIPQAGTQ